MKYRNQTNILKSSQLKLPYQYFVYSTIFDFTQIYGLDGYLYSLLRPFVSLSQAVNLFSHISMGRQTYRTQGVCVCVCVCCIKTTKLQLPVGPCMCVDFSSRCSKSLHTHTHPVEKFRARVCVCVCSCNCCCLLAVVVRSQSGTLIGRGGGGGWLTFSLVSLTNCLPGRLGGLLKY